MNKGGEQRIPRPPSVRAGDPAPWADLPSAGRVFTLDAIRERLVSLPPVGEARALVPGSVAAAVLVPLFEVDGEAHVVLTKRPDTMPSHQGEIAFPGGKFDPAVDRDLRDTALREAEEEIGLDPATVELVAQLEGLSTVASKFVITPFVGFLPRRPDLTPDEREVVRVIEVPLAELMDDDVYREERWESIRPEFFPEGLGVHFYELADETVWGATARILTGFLAHLVAGQ